MSEAAKKTVAGELDAFEREYASMLKQDEGLSAAAVAKRLAELEAEYC